MKNSHVTKFVILGILFILNCLYSNVTSSIKLEKQYLQPKLRYLLI